MLPNFAAGGPQSNNRISRGFYKNPRLLPDIKKIGDLKRDEHEECVYTPDGTLKFKVLRRPGEKTRTCFDERGRAVSEEVAVGWPGPIEYSSHAELQYDEHDRLKICRTENSLGEQRVLEYNSQGKPILETVSIKREGQKDFFSTTRCEYYEDGTLKSRSYEDSFGERRRTEYDTLQRKVTEDYRIAGPEHGPEHGCIAHTEYAYGTDEVEFPNLMK